MSFFCADALFPYVGGLCYFFPNQLHGFVRSLLGFDGASSNFLGFRV